MLQLPEIVPVHEYENSDAPTSPDIFVGGAFGLGSRRFTGSAQYRQWNILQVVRIDSGGLKVDPVSADCQFGPTATATKSLLEWASKPEPNAD
jgi:hypothetical protein